MNESNIKHISVLSKPLVEQLAYGDRAVVVDATVGLAGHSLLLGQRLGQEGKLIGLDVDQESLEQAGKRLSQLSCPVHLIRENFGKLRETLATLGLEKVDVILADLGVCSIQLDQPEKGFSFQNDAPLDMRMDSRLTVTAEELVNTLGQDELADLIYQYGEEWKSRRIARQIVQARKEKRIQTSFELVDAIYRALGMKGHGRKSRIHPATKTFQALRIAVNDELKQLEKLLKAAPELLNPGGQIAVISFHSLEDRLVKWNFRENKQLGCYEIMTKKPIVAEERERKQNPRSRSAKLRIAKKL